jgi:hypothetical protein
MSASAYAKVLYGFELTEELLRVADGTVFECRSNSQHQIVPDKAFCPCCGSHVEEVARMIYSPLLLDFARKHGMTGDAARAKLSKYQWKGPREWNTDRRKWVFGVLVAEEGTNKMCSFEPIGPKRKGIDMVELTEVFFGMGFNPDEAKYILMVELS